MSALLLRDRVKETTTTTGTGTLTLAGAATGYQAFSVAGDGARCRFCTEDGTNWEVAEGIYTASGTTLTRATIIASSNGGAAVSWSAGSKNVFLVADASFMAGLPSISASTTAPTNPRDNDLWFKTDEGSLKIYYNDGDSSQWIDLMAGQPLVGGMVRIGKVVCVGGETSVVFNNIPQTFSDLAITYNARDTGVTGVDGNFAIQFNGDTTSGNYTNTTQVSVAGTTASNNHPTNATAGIGVGAIPDAGSTAGECASGVIEIANYAGTTFNKNAYGRGFESAGTGNASPFIWHRAGEWLNTAAITKITIPAPVTAFAPGSTFTLYGLG